MIRLTYNAPVVLTFSLASLVILLVSMLTGGRLIRTFFTVYPTMQWSNPIDYCRLVSHVLGHQNMAHLVGNLTFILLLGPALEEKYGALNLAEMIVLTALVTGLTTVLFFSHGLLGASGIVFMMILLSSFTNVQKQEIPLTFVMIAILFLGKEVLGAFRADGISQAAHLIGGICGALFGGSRAYAKPANHAAPTTSS